MHKAFKSSFKNLGLVPSSSPQLEKEDIARLIFCVAPNKILNVKNFKKSETRAKNFTFRHFRKKETEKSMPFFNKYLPKISKREYFKYSFFFYKTKGFFEYITYRIHGIFKIDKLSQSAKKISLIIRILLVIWVRECAFHFSSVLLCVLTALCYASITSFSCGEDSRVAPCVETWTCSGCLFEE